MSLISYYDSGPSRSSPGISPLFTTVPQRTIQPLPLIVFGARPSTGLPPGAGVSTPQPQPMEVGRTGGTSGASPAPLQSVSSGGSGAGEEDNKLMPFLFLGAAVFVAFLIFRS